MQAAIAGSIDFSGMTDKIKQQLQAQIGQQLQQQLLPALTQAISQKAAARKRSCSGHPQHAKQP